MNRKYYSYGDKATENTCRNFLLSTNNEFDLQVFNPQEEYVGDLGLKEAVYEGQKDTWIFIPYPYLGGMFVEYKSFDDFLDEVKMKERI